MTSAPVDVTLARVRRLVRAVGWSTADQVFAAGSNLVVTVAVARFAGAEALGRYSIVFAVYLLVLGFSRSLAGEPMIARPRAGGSGPGQVGESAGLTVVLGLATAAGLVCALAGTTLGRAELVLLGLGLPVALWQDQLRYTAFRRLRTDVACLMDGAWLVCSAAGWVLLSRSDEVDVVGRAVAVWVCGALLGAVVGAAVLGVRPAPFRSARRWWSREARPLSLPLLGDSLVTGLAGQAFVFVVGWLSTEEALGLLRAGQVYFGPLGLLLTALATSAVPRIARRRRPVDRRMMVGLVAMMTAASVVVSLAVLAASGLLHRLFFADRLSVPASLLLPLAAQSTLAGTAAALMIVAKTRGRGGDLVRSRLLSAVVGTSLLVAATAAWGAAGAAWAAAVQTLWYVTDLGLRTWRDIGPDAGRASVLDRAVPEGCRRRLKVVVVVGGVPADPRFLEHAAQAVDLVVYRSDWLQPGATSAKEVPASLRVRTFRPLVRSRRGHLAFVYRGLDAALSRDRPDVVHVVSEPWGLLAVQAAGWVRRRPGTALVLHGCDTIWHHGGAVERLARRLLVRRTLPVTSAWLAENSTALALARPLLPVGAVLRRVHTNSRDDRVFRVPTEEERRAAREALGLPVDAEVVTMLGRLVPEKGVGTLLEAFTALATDRPGAKLVVAGEGPCGDLFTGHGDGVRRLGTVPYPDGVVDLLRAADVVACPSWSTPRWEDQGPRVLIEAMMSGCIPVGTRSGGIPELLDGVGILVAQRDATDLARGLSEALRTAARREPRHMVAEHAREVYSASAVAEQLVDAWRAAFSGRTGPRVASGVGGGAR